MSAVILKPNRAYPSLPEPDGTPENTAEILKLIKEAIEIGERRAGSVYDSYIRVRDLLDLGFINLDEQSGTITAPDDDTDASAAHNHNSLYYLKTAADGLFVRHGISPLSEAPDNYVYINRSNASNPAFYAVQADNGPAIRAGKGTLGSTTFTEYVEIGETGNHITMIAAAPKLKWNETDAGTDEKIWDIVPVSGNMRFRMLNDADSASTDWMSVDRTGYASCVLTLPSTTLVDLRGTMSTRYGINGDYSTVGGSGNYGATIWSLDTAFDGAESGSQSASTGVYGIRWLRASHTDAASSGEGLHVFQNGTLYSALTTLGVYLLSSGKIGWGSFSTTYITEGTDNQIRLGTDHGYVELGAQNTSYNHHVYSTSNGFYTASGMHFNGTMRRYNKGAYLFHASTSYVASGAGAITVQSGGSPTGGSNGDIFLIY